MQEHVVEQPRELGQVQADEIRVKQQGKISWMALAMTVGTRLWLAGEVSEQRDLGLIRRLLARVRRCAARRPLLICTDGFRAYPRAIREAFRDALPTGKPGRPRLRLWKTLAIAQVVKHYVQRRVVRVERRIVVGTAAQVEKLRRRSQGGPGVLNTAYIERLNATFRERLAALTRRGRALARCTTTLHVRDVPDRHRLQLLHLSYEPLREPRPELPALLDARHGGCAHRPPLDGSRTAVVPCSAATLDAPQAARASPRVLFSALLSGGAHDHGLLGSYPPEL